MILKQLFFIKIFILLIFSPLNWQNQHEVGQVDKNKIIAQLVVKDTTIQNNLEQKSSIKLFSDYERDVVSLCGYTLRTIQLMITILSVVVALVSFVSIGMVLLYRSRLEKIDERRKDLSDKVNNLDNKISEIKPIVENLDSKKVALDNETVRIKKKLDDVENSLKKIDEEKERINSDYKNIASKVSALSKVIQIQDINAPRRLSHIQDLGQMINPVGVAPLLAVLLNNNEDSELRIEAAFGLGRYSENPDINIYWRQILEGFRNVLENLAIEENLFFAVINASVKYGTESKIVLNNLLIWSRDSRASIRRCCAESFGQCLIFDPQVDQRLKEMILSDDSNEVKVAAKISDNKIKEFYNMP